MNDIPDNIPDETMDDIPDDLPDETMDDIPHDLPDETMDDIPDDLPDETMGDIPDNIPDETMDDIPDDLPDDVPDEVALLQAQLDVQAARLRLYENVVQRRRARRRRQRGRRRRFWFRPWLGPERRRQFGLYDQLMVELRAEDPKSFCNFMRMPPEMFDEILLRIGPRITKQHTWFRAPIKPGMKLAITLRHLASGAKYMDMRYGWRVPHNTISKIVREVNKKYLILIFSLFLHVSVLIIFCTFRFAGRLLTST